MLWELKGTPREQGAALETAWQGVRRRYGGKPPLRWRLFRAFVGWLLARAGRVA